MAMNYNKIIDELLNTFSDIRYVALYDYHSIISKQRHQHADSSSAESDRYEELLVNPVLLTAARQRGNIDCGGLRFLLIAYGNFYQLIKETSVGHISICLEKQADISRLPDDIFEYLKSNYTELFQVKLV